jgi:hypothetical protein
VKRYPRLAIAIAILACCAFSCIGQQPNQRDLINDTFPEAQAEIRLVLEEIYADARTANIAGLEASHLNSPKFTKFGPRSFERQTVEETNRMEAAFVSSISNMQIEMQDLKIDVFGDVAIATYYPHVTFERDSVDVIGSGRQTLVFLKTDDGWKIIHEHGTPKREGEGQQSTSE